MESRNKTLVGYRGDRGMNNPMPDEREREIRRQRGLETEAFVRESKTEIVVEQIIKLEDSCEDAEAEVERLREALSFYADDRRYMVDEDAVLVRSAGVDESVLDEGGERARAALSPVRVNPMPDERVWTLLPSQACKDAIYGPDFNEPTEVVPKSSREAAEAERDEAIADRVIAERDAKDWRTQAETECRIREDVEDRRDEERRAAEAEVGAARQDADCWLRERNAALSELGRLREAIKNVLRWDWALTDDPADWPEARDAAVKHLRAALSPREDAQTDGYCWRPEICKQSGRCEAEAHGHRRCHNAKTVTTPKEDSERKPLRSNDGEHCDDCGGRIEETNESAFCDTCEARNDL